MSGRASGSNKGRVLQTRTTRGRALREGRLTEGDDNERQQKK